MFSEPVNVNVAMNDSSSGLDGIIDKSSFHSFNKLIIITYYVKRFIENCKLSINGKVLLLGDVTGEEKAAVERLWLINEQKTIDSKTMNELTISLGGYVDDDGVSLKGDHWGINYI